MAINPYASPTSDPDDGPPGGEDSAAASLRLLRSAKRRILYWMLALAAVSGLVAGWFGPQVDPDLDRVLTIAISFVFTLLLLRWCEHDRRERSLAQWRFFTVMMVICPGWLIIMPLYFISSRGLAGGALAMLKGVAFLVLMLVVFLTVGSAILLFTG